jgi:hypothetical protein
MLDDSWSDFDPTVVRLSEMDLQNNKYGETKGDDKSHPSHR